MTQTIITAQAAIETRRSIRTYTAEPIPAAALDELLRLTGLAPSAWNTQPWRFVVVQNKDMQAQLRAAAYDQPQVTGAPAVIVLYSDMEDVLAHAGETAHPGMGEAGAAQQEQTLHGVFGSLTTEQRAQWANAQANIALGFLLIAARSLGYDTSPMLGFDPTRVKQLLNLPGHVHIAAMVPVGRAAESGYPHHRHATARVTRWM